MTPTPIEVGADIQAALCDMRSALQIELDKRLTKRSTKPVLVRVERLIGHLSLIGFLKHSTAMRKIHWRDRAGTFELAGVGAAEIVSGEGISDADRMFALMRERLSSADLPSRYFGGFRFDRNNGAVICSEEWRGFGGGSFVLPLIEISRHHDRTQLAAQVVIDPGKRTSAEDLLLPFDSICDSHRINADKIKRATGRDDFPNRKEWDGQIGRILKTIKAGGLQKLVLARRVTCGVGEPPNLFSVIEKSFSTEESATVFAFQIEPHHGFFGASPELLFSRAGREIISEAVAGTRRHTSDRKESDRLADELLASQKERREVDLVRSGIDRNLTPLCSRLQIDEQPHIHHAGNVQHLRYSFSGRLKMESTDAGILQALSPTPAVCGTPRETAIKLIRELEPFDRGWYAGPIGWISGDASEFVVAIRSALVHGSKIHLYSGVGLVEGSESETEWNELETKIASVAATLGI
jgi:menaquinone-specific isochorismate synthase